MTVDVHIGYVGRSNNIKLKQLLKRTKTFIEADFIVTMMSWSYILMSRFFSCKITTCIRQRLTEDRINSRPQMLSS